MNVDGFRDRGYAWFIPFACCYINAVLFGIYRSYGIVLTVILKTYSVSRSEATWFISLCMTVIHLTGPFSGLLNSYFTVRTITLVGCFLATLGVGLCYFATTVSEIVIYIGIIQGFGIGLTYVQIPAIINEYFVKFRATANGLAMSGGTIGAFIFCPVTEYMLKYLTLDMCFLILSIITLGSMPVALFLKPIKDVETSCNKKKLSKIFKKTPIILVSIKTGDDKVVESANTVTLGNNVRKDSVITKPIKATCETVSKMMSNFAVNMERKLSTFNTDSTTKLQESEKTSRFKQQVKLILSVVINPFFVLICSTHLAYFWGSLTYMMVVIDYAEDRGIWTSKAAQLLTIYSGGDLLGRLASGWFMDCQCIPIKYLAIISVLFIGFILKAVPYFDNIYLLMGASAGLGLLSGVIVVLLNVLFCHYLDTERAPLAFGLSSFFCGLATLVRPMAVGYFRDRTGSYDGLFDLLSIFALCAAAIWFLEPFIKKSKAEEQHVQV